MRSHRQREISTYRFEGGANMGHKWVKMCSSGGICEGKRTKEHLERGWVVVSGWGAEMHEWWSQGESRRGKQRSDGVWGAGMWWVMPRSDLISVFWLTGWEQREVRALLTATHSALCQISTGNQQTDRLGYPIRNFHPPLPFHPPTPPLSLHLSWSASHVKSLAEFNYTCCPCSSQTSAAPPAGSWPGEGQQPPGNWFMWRVLVHGLTRVLLSITLLFLLFVLPCTWKCGLYRHRHGENWKKNKK